MPIGLSPQTDVSELCTSEGSITALRTEMLGVVQHLKSLSNLSPLVFLHLTSTQIAGDLASPFTHSLHPHPTLLHSSSTSMRTTLALVASGISLASAASHPSSFRHERRAPISKRFTTLTEQYATQTLSSDYLVSTDEADGVGGLIAEMTRKGTSS